MKKILSIFALLAGVCAQAQELRVTDENGHALPFATVTARQGTNSLQQLTDRMGWCRFPAAWLDKPVALSVAYVGFLRSDTLLTLAAQQTLVLAASPFQLEQVVVTAQYQPLRTDQIVHQMKVIDRQQMDAMGAVNVRDVLRQQVNVRIGQDNILGSSVGLQGLSGQNVKVLVDGVPVIGRLNGNIDISQLNLNTIERIEVIEGPMAVNYGTDALAGTINLITRTQETAGVSGAINSYYESVGQYNIDGRLAYQHNRHQVRLSAGRNYFDGWRSDHDFLGWPKRTLADESRVLNWDPKMQYFGRLDYRFTLPNGFIAPYVEHFDEWILNRGTPRPPYGLVAFDDTYKTLRTNAGWQWQQALGSRHRFQMVAAYNRFHRTKNTWRTDLSNLDRQLTAIPGDQDTSRFQVWMSRGQWSRETDSTTWQYELGYEFNVEQAIGARMEEGVQWQHDVAVFSTAEWRPLPQLTIRPGLRYTYNSNYAAPLIPSLHLLWRQQGITLRASYAQGFRAPTLKELYFQFEDINHNIAGNKDLRAEYAHNVQVQVGWKRVTSTAGYQVKWSGFYNDITDLITLAQSGQGDQFTYINVGLFRSMGTQGTFEWQRQAFQTTWQVAYIGQFFPEAQAAGANGFAFAPQVSGQFQYRIHDRWQLAGFWQYSGAVPGFALNSREELVNTRIAAFHTLDFTLTGQLWKDRLQWQVGGKNLLDVQNIQITGPSGGVHGGGGGSQSMNWGRSIFTRITWQW